MKIVIEIDNEHYERIMRIEEGVTVYPTTLVLYEAVKNGTPLEAQSNRCDSCTHSEEQDGSNCYECVKGMADNFETQPSENCISILNRIMEYTCGMLTAEKIGLQHLIKSMMDELSGGDSE